MKIGCEIKPSRADRQRGKRGKRRGRAGSTRVATTKKESAVGYQRVADAYLHQCNANNNRVAVIQSSKATTATTKAKANVDSACSALAV